MLPIPTLNTMLPNQNLNIVLIHKLNIIPIHTLKVVTNFQLNIASTGLEALPLPENRIYGVDFICALAILGD